MSARALAAALAVAALAACVELPDVARGTCGNGVVEPAAGEECDGGDGCGQAGDPFPCLRVCDAAGDGCPAGEFCGADRRCRAATGTFVVAGTQPVGALGASVLDLDRDGAADLIGHDARGLVVRWGDPEGVLAASTRVGVPPSPQPACLLDVDRDGGRDLVSLLPDLGWTLFAGDGRGFAPVVQSSIELPFSDGCERVDAGTAQVDPAVRPRVVIVEGGRTIGLLDGSCAAAPLDCVLSEEGGALVSPGVIAAPLGFEQVAGVLGGDQVAVALVGAREVSVWGQATGGDRLRRVATWTARDPLSETARIAFARLDADDCFDLLVGGDDEDLSIAPGVPDGAGGCAGLEPDLYTLGQPRGTWIGVIDSDGDGRDELLYLTGVGPQHLPGPRRRVVARRLTDEYTLEGSVLLDLAEEPVMLVALDYNHDGRQDLAAVFAGSSAVDLHLRHPGGAYTRFPVDVGGAPVALAVGDFDGDLHQDLLVTVARPASPERDRVVVIYGDPSGRPDGPHLVGDFAAAARAHRVAGGVQPTTDSALVVSNRLDDHPAACRRAIAVLLGDTSRQLVSPYVHLVAGDGGLAPLRPFASVDVSTPGAARVLALGELPGGPAAALLELEGPAFTPGAAVDLPGVLAPHLARARWQAVPASGDRAVDVVGIAVERFVTIEVRGDALDARSEPLPAPMVDGRLDLADLDGDGAVDGFGASVVVVDGALRGTVWVAWGLDVAATSVFDLPDGVRCLDAAALPPAAGALPELVLACTVVEDVTLSYAVARVAVGRAGLGELALAPAGELVAIRAGDLTGDGLPDLALIGPQTVTVLRQCRADEPLVRGCLGFQPR